MPIKRGQESGYVFSIRLDDKLKNGLCPGVITIGDFSEGFEASLCYGTANL